MAKRGILDKVALERNMTVTQLVISTFNEKQSVAETAAALKTTRPTIYGIMARRNLVIKQQMVQEQAAS